MKLLVLIIVLSVPGALFAQQRTADKTWWLVTAASVGATVADAENTQYCLRDPHCQEGNPFYFSRRPSRLRMYAVNAAFVVPETFYSYKWKREDDADRVAGRTLAKWRWYAMPIINMVTHGLGVTITLAATGR